ncbi:MAG: sulfite exporter TauE/SafE family protein [Cyclobacteriaceae bacterium]|nr:sulfite exporter TauE/SafE family protein [Cyclobacteriaceae bacterium]
MLVTAFLIGLLGSMHCVLMCGPLATIVSTGTSHFSTTKFFYNSGRILSYTLLGIVSFLAGKFISFAGFQGQLSLIAGVLILIGVIFYVYPINTGIKFIHAWAAAIRMGFGKLLKSNGVTYKFLLGTVNGFLPCGLVYFAVVGAMVSDSLIYSVLYMVAFGLGTWPAMWLVPQLFLKLQKQINLTKWVPVVVSLIAVLLIIRGLHLGIPYLSPPIFTGEITGNEVICE